MDNNLTAKEALKKIVKRALRHALDDLEDAQPILDLLPVLDAYEGPLSAFDDLDKSEVAIELTDAFRDFIGDIADMITSGDLTGLHLSSTFEDDE
jgi:hypothetical protein